MRKNHDENFENKENFPNIWKIVESFELLWEGCGPVLDWRFGS